MTDVDGYPPEGENAVPPPARPLPAAACPQCRTRENVCRPNRQGSAHITLRQVTAADCFCAAATRPVFTSHQLASTAFID